MTNRFIFISSIYVYINRDHTVIQAVPPLGSVDEKGIGAWCLGRCVYGSFVGGRRISGVLRGELIPSTVMFQGGMVHPVGTIESLL